MKHILLFYIFFLLTKNSSKLFLKQFYIYQGPVYLDTLTLAQYKGLARATNTYAKFQIKMVLDTFNPQNADIYQKTAAVPDSDDLQKVDLKYLKGLKKMTKFFVHMKAESFKNQGYNAEGISPKYSEFKDFYQDTIEHFKKLDNYDEDNMKQLLKISKKYILLSNKYYEVRSKVLITLGKLHRKYLTLTYEDCATTISCQVQF